jgi:succinate dehydrogenase/fumarate reductase flavoprotein subunit
MATDGANGYDAVVIGGGHNGLVAATYLGKAGLRTVVLERRETLGGATITSELAPGIRVPTLAHTVGRLRPSVVRDLELKRHGLSLVGPDVRVFAPGPDGDAVVLWGDVARTAEGLLDFRRFGGTLYNRTAFAGATTGQQLLYSLDEQVSRHEAAGLVTKYEGWEFVGSVQDGSGRCVGLVALDLRTMKTKAFKADAVMIATGGPGAASRAALNPRTSPSRHCSKSSPCGDWMVIGVDGQLRQVAENRKLLPPASSVRTTRSSRQ